MKLMTMVVGFGLCAMLGCDDDDDNGVNDRTPGAPTAVPQARGAASPPTLGSQIDRMGRPAITTALIGTFNPDTDVANNRKDAYNAAAQATWPSFRGSVEANLAVLDGLDGTCGNQLLADNANPAGRYAALATVVLDDQLYVNTAAGTCGTYLGLEAELGGALGAGAGGCGGRTPLDDVIERSYSVLAAGALAGIDDTLASDGQPHSLTAFPFLAAPN